MAPKIIKRNIDVIPLKSVSNTNALWKILNLHSGVWTTKHDEYIKF